jgi:hypothetical protein
VDTVRHSGLDPETSLLVLDSAFEGMTALESVKKSVKNRTPGNPATMLQVSRLT